MRSPASVDCEIEDTFAGRLGGASGGLDLFEAMPSQVRRDTN